MLPGAVQAEEGISERAPTIPFPPSPGLASSVPCGEITLRFHPNTFAKCCIIGPVSPVISRQWGLEKTIPATSVQLPQRRPWRAGQKGHFLGLKEQRATGRIRALLLGEWDSTPGTQRAFVMSGGETSKVIPPQFCVLNEQE